MSLPSAQVGDLPVEPYLLPIVLIQITQVQPLTGTLTDPITPHGSTCIQPRQGSAGGFQAAWIFPQVSSAVRKHSRAITRPFPPHPLIAIAMTTVDGVNGTVCNAEQYHQSLSSYDNPNPSISCLTRGQSIGLVVSTCLSQAVLGFILRAAGFRGFVLQFVLCSGRVRPYCRTSNSLSHVYPV